MSIAAGLGVLVAAGELVSRYRDEPGKALGNWPGFGYMAFNAGIGVIAYLIVCHIPDPSGEGSILGQLGSALVGGLGGITIMRAKFFTIRIGDVRKSIGPGNLIDTLLDYFDRQIDRQRALDRFRLVRELMKDIDFYKAAHYAKVQIAGALQNPSVADREKMGVRFREIADGDFPMREKAHALGFLILDLMGEDFLRDLFRDNRADFLIRADERSPNATTATRDRAGADSVASSLARQGFRPAVALSRTDLGAAASPTSRPAR
ncbi:MAG: hypothetical protein GY835_04870 [bacterium]|nr:hypothetical protein [bacterium]